MQRLVEKHKSAYLYFISFVASTGGFIWSYHVILMSGGILFLKNYFHMSQLSVDIFSHHVSASWIEGFTMTSAILGTVIGMIVGGQLADGTGRKRTLIIAAVLLITGTIGTTIPKTLVTWNLFRILGGVGGGLASLVSPMYISEISPAMKRGALMVVNQLAIVLGAFAANLTTFVIARHIGSNAECWRWIFASAGVPATIFLLGLIIIPDSPRWLLMKGREAQARRVLARIGGSQHAEQTVQIIREYPNQKVGSYRGLFQPGIRIATFVVFGLALLVQWVGVPTLIYYAPTLFVNAGISSNASAIGNTVILRVGDILCMILAMLWVDKYGRRPLLLVGTIGMALGQFLMGVCFYQNARSIFMLLAFLLSESAYSISVSPVSTVLTTEIFPNRLRARGMAIYGFIRLVSSLFLTQIFPPAVEFLRAHLGSEAGIFWIFSIICLLGLVFTILWVPETKNRTLEQISNSYVMNV
jgi:SP family arabinose:H+ symporter-like MFS transporter